MEGLQTVGSGLLTLGARCRGGGLSLYQRLDLEKDIGIAVVRSFVQLAAIGYVIDYVFGLESLGAVALLLAGMVLFAAWTSARRASVVPRSFLVAAGAIGGGGRSDVGGFAPPADRASYGPLPHPARGHGHRQLHEHREPHPHQDARRHRRAAAEGRGGPRSGSHQPTGRRSHPEDRAPAGPDPAHRRHEDHGHNLPARRDGGMIIAGADPLEAVRLQIVVLYMLLGSVSIAAILVGLALLPLLLHPAPPAQERRRSALLGPLGNGQG